MTGSINVRINFWKYVWRTSFVIYVCQFHIANTKADIQSVFVIMISIMTFTVQLWRVFPELICISVCQWANLVTIKFIPLYPVPRSLSEIMLSVPNFMVELNFNVKYETIVTFSTLNICVRCRMKNARRRCIVFARLVCNDTRLTSLRD